MKCNAVTAVALFCLVQFSIMPASAGYFALTNNDSWMDLDTEGLRAAKGMFGMGSGIVDHMYEHWFWYRTGSYSPEIPITAANLSLISEQQPQSDTLITVLGGLDFQACITTLLKDNPAGPDTVGCTITVTITNTSGSSLDFHLFAYTDFDLNDSIDNSWLQIDSDGAVQAIAGIVSRESLSPQASAYTVAQYPDLVTRLNDSMAEDFDNSGSMGVADNTYGHQWNRSMPANSSFTIEINMTCAPTTNFTINSFTINSIATTGTTVNLTWESNPAEYFTVLYSTNLLLSQWYSFPGMTSMPGAIGNMSASVTTNLPTIYYRIRSSETP